MCATVIYTEKRTPFILTIRLQTEGLKGRSPDMDPGKVWAWSTYSHRRSLILTSFLGLPNFRSSIQNSPLHINLYQVMRFLVMRIDSSLIQLPLSPWPHSLTAWLGCSHSPNQFCFLLKQLHCSWDMLQALLGSHKLYTNMHIAWTWSHTHVASRDTHWHKICCLLVKGLDCFCKHSLIWHVMIVKN